MAQDVTQNLEAPINGGEAVVISAADHTATTKSRALWVGSFGNVKVDLRDGASTITFNNVQDGTLLPFRVVKVYKTGTTASNMVLVW